jgi:hypothetical protein
MPNYANNSYDTRLKEIRDTYFKICHVRCPGLNNELVYFNQVGFRHFLRKGKLIRPIKDQLRRFGLFRFATKVVTSNRATLIETRKNGTVVSYAFTLEVKKSYTARVVIMKNNDGPYQFVSIMD